MNIFNTMTMAMTLTLATTAITSAANAQNLPEGSFRGKSNQVVTTIKNPDVMALILKKDPNSSGHLAILGEYTRVPGTPALGTKLVLTSWVPRLYIYQVVRVNELQFVMKPLFVDEAGKVITRDDVQFDTLTLKTAGSLDRAFVTRFDRQSRLPIETIQIDGRVGSTWESFVPGDFMLTNDSSGRDYSKKTVNVKIAQDGFANYYSDEIVGKFRFTEQGRGTGVFTVLPAEENVKGADKLTGRIGVFIDIVNWKHMGIQRFTTEELLMINPDDASDVGFYYERHAK